MAASHQDLVNLYKAILGSLSCVISDDMVSLAADGDISPVRVGDKRMVIPTPDVLRVLASNPWIAFHPISESIVRGESPVLKRLRTLVNWRLTTAIYKVVFGILDTAADTSRHSALAPSLTQILSDLGDIDDKTIANVTRTFAAMNPVGEYRMINIFLRRGGELKGTAQRRTAMVTFPFVTEHMAVPDYKVCGIDWRKKDVVAMRKLMALILPDVDYNAGSNSDIAPYFDALMKAFVNVATALNSISWKFRKHIPDYDQVHIDLSWVDSMKDLMPYKGVISALPGNDGDNVNGTPTPTVEAVTPTPGLSPGLGQAPVVTAPIAVGATAPITSTLGAPPVINTVVGSNGIQRRVTTIGADVGKLDAAIPNGTTRDDGSAWFSMIQSTMFSPPVLPRFRAAGDTSMPIAITVGAPIGMATPGGLGVPGQQMSAIASFQMAMQAPLPTFKAAS